MDANQIKGIAQLSRRGISGMVGIGEQAAVIEDQTRRCRALGVGVAVGNRAGRVNIRPADLCQCEYASEVDY